jgi:hypothetical protein
MSYLSLPLNNLKLFKNTVVHLVGLPTSVSRATEEIQHFSDENNLSCKVINNSKVAIINEYLYSNLIINKCNLITCKDISQLHDFVKLSSMYNYHSYAFLVKLNNNNKFSFDNNLTECPSITDIYNLHESYFHKKNLLYNYLT